MISDRTLRCNVRYLFFIVASVFFVKLTSPNQLNFDTTSARTHAYTCRCILLPVVIPLCFALVDNFPTRPCVVYARRKRGFPPTIAKLLTAHNICLSPKRRPFDLSRVKFFRLHCCTEGSTWDHEHRRLLRFREDVEENKAGRAKSVAFAENKQHLQRNVSEVIWAPNRRYDIPTRGCSNGIDIRIIASILQMGIRSLS